MSYSKQMKEGAKRGVPWDSDLFEVPSISLESWFQLCVGMHVPWFPVSPHRTEEEFLSLHWLWSAAERASSKASSHLCFSLLETQVFAVFSAVPKCPGVRLGTQKVLKYCYIINGWWWHGEMMAQQWRVIAAQLWGLEFRSHCPCLVAHRHLKHQLQEIGCFFLASAHICAHAFSLSHTDTCTHTYRK